MSTDPVAIVTGGSGGIAPGIVRALCDAGFVVVITARGLERLTAAAEELGKHGTVLALGSDATDPVSIRHMVDSVLSRFGRIDVLVNAAASSNPIGGAIEQVDIDMLMTDVDIKVGGYLRYIQGIVPVMKAQGEGHVINIGGLTGRSSDTLSGLRNVGVVHLTKVLSDQLGPFGISVNAVHPGIVRTPHLVELFDEMAKERGVDAQVIEAEFTADIPTGAILDVDAVGRMVAFLAGAPDCSITGQSLTVDGGYSRGIYL
ncbi:SDR family oxidoreductase [Novosphingobium taihuense]|uniref:NAD(P)-dependent dehydrogenase (Short-subunit alcohol dehydrogenase family) n=1 Tax=Novosphingobium taihuense TaxID=260085 RepID=A0A7W7ABL2_9SPHN|nr:SDR family oxidoreductase [Novosphingobium taihuense]MBB4614004.1 NAD(P)-dependent dehydrogenase (short-subunit alcohol dehydrogenase family) [Novosphingobium taihuense]TWH86855.1 NAD(P)-dependent dehydrogenase (short-subunit alcohol dehydrogenase family) [Novosphingobium taihuense]